MRLWIQYKFRSDISSLKSRKETDKVWHPIKFDRKYDQIQIIATTLIQYLPKELVKIIIQYESTTNIIFEYDDFASRFIDKTGVIPFFVLNKLLIKLKKLETKTYINEPNFLQYFTVTSLESSCTAIKITNREDVIDIEAHKKLLESLPSSIFERILRSKYTGLEIL